MDRIDRRDNVGHGRGAASREVVELELIGRDDVGNRQHALLEEFRNAGPHEDAAVDIADHRIAAIARRRICALHPFHRIGHGFAGVGRAEIAGEHAVALAQHAALLDALHHQTDRLAAENAASPMTITGVIGELHGVNRPHLHADALQRKHGGGIADVTIGDVGLDGEDVHAGLDERTAALCTNCWPQASRCRVGKIACRTGAPWKRRSREPRSEPGTGFAHAFSRHLR